tara:strand:+ start:206 stop:430 length:225 start_codon:yes stop_codon:yes gene_type:complete
MDIIELTKWVVHRGDDLYSLDKQVQFKQKLKKYFAEQLLIHSVSESKEIINCHRCEFDDRIGICPKCDTDAYSR